MRLDRYDIKPIQDKHPSWWAENRLFIANLMIRTLTIAFIGYSLYFIREIYVRDIVIDVFK